MTLVDLYLRLSDGRTENGSLPARERKLRSRADRNGWTVHRVVIENDLSTGNARNASAFKRRKITLPSGKVEYRVIRPGFRSILADLEAGRAHALLAEDLDRVVRDPRDGEDLLDIVERNKCSADSISDSLRLTNGGTDAEIYAFRGAVNAANKASKDTARRVRAARERQAEDGRWGGGRRPYGFDADGVTVCPAEADEIRRAADQLLAGISLRAISADLRTRKVPSVTGAHWTPETLRDILLRPRNAGIVVYQGRETDKRLDGEPILAEDLWRAVVDKLTDPARATNPGRAPLWLGSGLYRCVCGSPMEIARGTGRAAAYRCAHEGGTGDTHVRRNAVQLDEYIGIVIVERLSRPDAVDLIAKPSSPEVDVKALRRQAKALRQRKAKLSAMLGADEIDDADFAAASKANRTKLDAIEAQLASVADRSPLAAVVGAEDVQAAWDKCSLGQKRAIVDELCTVTVLPAGRGRGFDPTRVQVAPRT
jgi:site-specific DNA recombinase